MAANCFLVEDSCASCSTPPCAKCIYAPLFFADVQKLERYNCTSLAELARACLDEKEDPDDVAVKKLDHAFAETRNRDCDAETS